MKQHKRTLTHAQYFEVRNILREEYGEKGKLNMTLTKLASKYSGIVKYPVSEHTLMEICGLEGIETVNPNLNRAYSHKVKEELEHMKSEISSMKARQDEMETLILNILAEKEG